MAEAPHDIFALMVVAALAASAPLMPQVASGLAAIVPRTSIATAAVVAEADVPQTMRNREVSEASAAANGSSAGGVYALAQDPTVVGAIAPSNRVTDSAAGWAKRCFRSPGTGLDTCTTSRDVGIGAGELSVSVMVREVTGPRGGRELVVSSEAAVQVQPGVKLTIDRGKALSMRYATCSVAGCTAQVGIDDAFIRALKRGQTLNISAIDPEGRPLSLAMSLDGFTKSYEANAVAVETGAVGP